MFNFIEVNLEKLVIHQVGNKLRDEGVHVSPTALEMRDGNIEELLLKYFLTSFKDKSFYKFFHEKDIQLNKVYQSVSSIFVDPSKFYNESVKILKHLYESSSYPKIKGGEFYMVYFTNCIVNEQKTDAIGIFKTEKKDTYLKITRYANEFAVGSEQCIDVKKLDKGCIIFNTNSDDGYHMALVDQIKKVSEETLYWKDEFLQINNVQDEYFQTETCLSVCQDFVENIYGEMHQAERKEKVKIMNETINYFDTHKEFQIDDFTREVVKDPELIEQFKVHKQNYDLNQGLDAIQEFTISTPAVKEMKKKVKNVIKLDTDFEIKVKFPSPENDNMQHMEHGFDEEKGMKYYKIFYNEEE